MQSHAPGTVIMTINKGPRFPGVTGPTNVLAGPFVLMASAKTPDKTVYQVVKALFENRKKLVLSHKAFNGMHTKNMHLDIGLPYHPGAEKFFKEKGM